MAGELAVINEQNAVEIFTKGGLPAILDGIEAKVRAIQLDGSTAAGRDDIRSVAYKVVRTKTALDTEGKKLTEGWREATKKVNAERAVAEQRLDALAEEVRRPLTEYENKEKARVAGHEKALADILSFKSMVESDKDISLDLLIFHESDFKAIHPDRKWEEFEQRGKSARVETELYLSGRIEVRKRFEVEREELARLRKAEAERLQLERDERLRVEAAEKATRAAELKASEDAAAERLRVQSETNKAKLESERLQREARELYEREEAAKLAAQRRAKEAEEAKIAAEKKAEEDRIAAEKKATEDLAAAQYKARMDAEEAVTRERERVESERQKVEAARLKREADEQHTAKIHREIADDCAEKSANEIATAIMAGKVRHVRVVV